VSSPWGAYSRRVPAIIDANETSFISEAEDIEAEDIFINWTVATTQSESL